MFAPAVSEPPQRPLDVAFWNAREGLLATEKNPRCGRCAADLFVTRDAGRSWRRLALDLPEPELAVDPGKSVAWVTSRGGVYRTTDRGRAWRRVGSRAVVRPVASGSRLWAFAVGDYARLLVTRDGRTWIRVHLPQRYCENGYSQVAPVSANRFWFVRPATAGGRGAC